MLNWTTPPLRLPRTLDTLIALDICIMDSMIHNTTPENTSFLLFICCGANKPL